LGRTGQFMGRPHLATPLQGARCISTPSTSPFGACWKRLAPTLLAGVPAIVKPAHRPPCQLTEAVFRLMFLTSGILPDGAIQLVTAGLGDMLDHPIVRMWSALPDGSRNGPETAQEPVAVERSVRFASEQDSFSNASV